MPEFLTSWNVRCKEFEHGDVLKNNFVKRREAVIKRKILVNLCSKVP